MRLFDLFAILIVLAAALSYLNLRFLRQPPAIGLMALSLLFSVGVVVAGALVPAVGDRARALVGRFDLSEALLHGMLGFMLFAGALHIDLGDLRRNRGPIAVLATFGVVVSTAIVGVMTWAGMKVVGVPLRFVDALL